MRLTNRHNREVLGKARAQLEPPKRRPIGLGHLLLAAAFAAVTAVAAAAAVILGVPGIDTTGLQSVTEAWGHVEHSPTPPQTPARRN
jgi:hypothetical protein